MTSNARVRRVKVSSPPGLVFPQLPGEKHLRHHITADGYYRGRKVIAK
ncbi:50S ribosomal protein L32 [Escherichia sp. HC-CC]